MSTFSLVELMAFLFLENFSKFFPSNNEKKCSVANSLFLEKKSTNFLRKYKNLRKIPWDFHTVFSLGTVFCQFSTQFGQLFTNVLLINAKSFLE
jgi:hypothetical protein